MDYGYLGDVVPGAIVAFLVLLAIIVGAVTWTAIRYHASGTAGTVGHDPRFARRQQEVTSSRR